MRSLRFSSFSGLLALVTVACTPAPDARKDAGAAPIAASAAGPAEDASAEERRAAPVREGGAIVRSASGDALYVADEDHRVVWVLPLPIRTEGEAFDGGASPIATGTAVSMPGPPAQVLALHDRILVTIRDPGLLVMMRPDKPAGLVEMGRVALPPDAWGIGITKDESLALVTSAWSQQVSAVDLAGLTRKWSIDVPREPRAVVVRPDGAGAYVTHLVGAALTRIDDLGTTPKARPIDLPAAPLRTPSGERLWASLGYAAVLSEDGRRLFAARHAIGAMGRASWFGAATVDVLLTASDSPLAPLHQGKLPATKSAFADQVITPDSMISLPGAPLTPFTQPRAVAYRKRTGTILVAGEGDDRLAELDASAVDPTLSLMATYPLGSKYDPHVPVAGVCGAPTGIALSADETVAWVFCRSTYDLATVELSPHTPAPQNAPSDKPASASGPSTPSPRENLIRSVHLADDPLGGEVAIGRRIFYNATDPLTSGGLGCAGCHPEGRDDGYVWHEAKFSTADGENTNFVGRSENIPEMARRKGVPRRTAMLAGRVGAKGPYGWHAENPDLNSRLKAGMRLHRWGGLPVQHTEANLDARALYLIAFLRKGLVPPPARSEPLSAQELRGKEIFSSEVARCSKCHTPETDYTDRMAYPLGRWPTRKDYDDDPRAEFKTPSLKFLAGRAPYFHDGSASSIGELIERNTDRMGRTNHLSVEDRAALIAFLRTL